VLFVLIVSIILFIDLHQIPRRIVSGLLSHHIYQEIDHNRIPEIMNGIKQLEIENVFIIADAREVEMVLGAVSNLYDNGDDGG